MFADKGSKRPILRFEGFNDDWEGRKLENSADYIRGSFPQPYGNKEWYGGTNAKPFVQVVDVNTNMRLNKKTKEQISVLAQPKSRFVPSDSIVVTLQGSIGRVAITQYDSYVDRTLLIFTKYKVPVDKYFWAYSIQNIFRIEKQKAPGGTIKTITKRALSSFEVSLPVQEEQKKIGTLLKNIDDIITSQQEEVSKLKKIKKSLLQQMFI
jgi:type I restriction enzyme S subunit